MVALSSLENLYRQVILDHANHPRNRKVLSTYQHQIELLNPTCGDAIQIQMQVVDERITEIAFNGYGCSIAIASASMMTEVLKGQTLNEAIQLIESFNDLVGGQALSQPYYDEADLSELLADAYLLEGVKQFPARYKCAVLAWKAAQACIHSVELDEGLELGSNQQERQERGMN